MRTTKQHRKYWEGREIDWKESYLSTWNHPHRFMITAMLGKIDWTTLYEVGVASGPNIVNIVKHFPNKHLGGCDVNEDAIKIAKEVFNGGQFDVSSVEDIMMSDNATDVLLSDMTLIYVDPFNIDKVIGEIKRVSRKYVLLCELHSENPFARWHERLTSGYHVYNYRSLLRKHGFEDITLLKIPKEIWDGRPQKPYGYIILAKTPKR